MHLFYFLFFVTCWEIPSLRGSIIIWSEKLCLKKKKKSEDWKEEKQKNWFDEEALL